MRKLIVYCDDCNRDVVIEVGGRMGPPSRGDAPPGWFDIGAAAMLPVEPRALQEEEDYGSMLESMQDAAELGLGPPVNKKTAKAVAELDRRNRSRRDRIEARSEERHPEQRYRSGRGELLICDLCIVKRADADPLWAKLVEQVTAPPTGVDIPWLPPSYVAGAL